MTKSLVTVKPHDTLRHARELMAKHRINQLPIAVDSKLVGIVTDRDIDEFADSYMVEDVMTYNVIAVSPQTSLREAARCLRTQRFGALPVVEKGELVGIITRSDLLGAILAGETRAD
jgi:CBS domain-containing protein